MHIQPSLQISLNDNSYFNYFHDLSKKNAKRYNIRILCDFTKISFSMGFR